MESCCTCAKLLSDVPGYDASSEKEKSLPSDRRLECCGRVICGTCIHDNARFNTYCPYCQISSSSSALPPGLKDPPSYTSSIDIQPQEPPPPPYTPTADDPRLKPPPQPSQPQYSNPPGSGSGSGSESEKEKEKSQTPSSPSSSSSSSSSSSPSEPEDTLHFLRLPHDTIPSLSLRYNVPAPALRRANRLHSDHLIAGRRTVVIPGAYYRGPGLSPRPVEGEEGERRARALRRWMVRCKVADYDVALLYLRQASYDLEVAVEAYLADEAWERAHPLEAARRGKKKKGSGSGSGVR